MIYRYILTFLIVYFITIFRAGSIGLFAIIPENLQLHSEQKATIFKKIPELDILHRLSDKAYSIRICCHNCLNKTSFQIFRNKTL